jgi:protein CpxP
MDSQMQELVASELRRIVTELNLTDAQKEQAKPAIEAAQRKIAEYKASGKTPTPQEVATWRANFREKLVAFLTPEQLKKWDAEVAKSKTFMGQAA